MKKSILATGINGLVGSKLIDLYEKKYSFDKIDISDPLNPVDITNANQVFKKFSNSNADYVVHFAAYTDVTGAWKQRGDKSGLAYKVNVVGTQNIIQACKRTNKHLVHISTAYVFDGNKEDLYLEDDEVSPIEWYGQTKAEAESAIRESEINWTILRIDQPFRSDTFPRNDIVRNIINGLKNDSLYPQFSNHYFGPTFIDDFAKIIDWVIRSNSTGIFNSTSGEKWSDFNFASLVNSTHDFHKIIKKGDINEYLKTLERPYQKNTAMSSEKLKSKIDFKLKTVEEAIMLVQI